VTFRFSCWGHNPSRGHYPRTVIERCLPNDNLLVGTGSLELATNRHTTRRIKHNNKLPSTTLHNNSLFDDLLWLYSDFPACWFSCLGEASARRIYPVQCVWGFPMFAEGQRHPYKNDWHVAILRHLFVLVRIWCRITHYEPQEVNDHFVMWKSGLLVDVYSDGNIIRGNM
jgi:hypothetical protein